MTLKKISRKEVLSTYVPNRFELFKDIDTEFPDRLVQNSGKTKNPDKEVNKLLTQKKSAKSLPKRFSCRKERLFFQLGNIPG